MKIKEFIKEWQSTILVVMFCLLYLGNCSTNRTIDKIRNDNKATIQSVDSLRQQFNSFDPINSIDLEIEGLKSERRMLQSVDRRILDVNRQAEIDRRLIELKDK